MVSKKFVQLGERRNGRIVKNEQYTVEKFIELVVPELDYQYTETINWFDKTFKTEKYIQQRLKKHLRNELDLVTLDIYDNIYTLIEQDNTGRSKRK